MSIPDPLSILHSILLIFDYGIQIAGAEEEIQGYHRSIARTSALVSEICANLETLDHYLDFEQKRVFWKAVSDAENELAKAQNLAQEIKKKGCRWSRDVGWVFKNKAAAQTYENAVTQCHSTLSRIDTKLFIVKIVRAPDENQSFRRRFVQQYSAAGT